MTAIRQRLMDYIETMPEHNLSIVEPILAHLADESDELIIDTDLTEEEKAEVEAALKEKEEHPENFTPLSEIARKTYGDNWREVLEVDNEA
jgi:hypothetical protein